MGGASEVPTILLGDTLIVNTAAYHLRLPYSTVTLFRTGSPKRGDMVQLRFPVREFIGFKRVMGLPGETIEVRESRVIINGQPIPVKPLNRADFSWVPEVRSMGPSVELEGDHYITYTPGKSEYRNHPPIRLATGEYFLLGDNRDDSWDSRAFGPVPENRILGKVIATLPTGLRKRR
jgi:signal peptidase I